MRRTWGWVAGVAAGIVVAAGVFASPNTVQAPSPKQLAITGTLFSAATDKPIPGAHVEVFRALDTEEARGRRAARDLSATPIAQATTGAGGAFSLTVPEGSRLLVVAEAKGHARSSLGRPIALPEDRDLGRFDLPKGRALSGKVVDASGKPVSGAMVMAYVERDPRRLGGGASFVRGMIAPGPAPFPSLATTGSDGQFAFESLPERAVTLRAIAPGMASALMKDVRFSSSVLLRLEEGHPVAGRVLAPDGKAAAVGAWVLAGDDGWDGAVKSEADGSFKMDHVRSGSVSLVASLPTPLAEPSPARSTWAPSAPLNVALPASSKTPPPVLRLRPGGIVRARLIDAESREPVTAAALYLDAPAETAPRPATTGKGGDAIFTGVPAGRIEMRADADGYLDEQIHPFSLVAGQTKEISLALHPAASLDGTVRDASGRPVAGATVSISGPPPMAISLPIPIYFPIGVDPVATDSQGRFALAPLPARAALKVSVASKDFAPWEMAGIKLRPGEKRAGMEVLLKDGETISGRVLDADGQPVAAASVVASHKPEGGPAGMVMRFGGSGSGRGGGSHGGRMGPQQGEDLPAVVTKKDGTFHVHGATAGIWSVDVEAEGFAPKSLGGLKLEETGGLDVGDVTLEPGAAVNGIVLGPNGEPVPYARCRVTKDFSVLADMKAAGDGTFGSRSLPTGETVSLAVDADGYASVEKPGLTTPIENLVISLTPASRVSGRVVDKETGKPVTDFSIAVSRSRGMGGGAMRMNMMVAGPETPFHTEDGTFLVEDVDPGKVSMAARAAGYRDATLSEVEVPEGKDLDGLTFSMEHAASVSGTITDASGRPIAGASVSKKENSGGGFGMRVAIGAGGATSDGDGRFVLDGLDRGPMTIEATHPDYESGTVDVDTTRDVENLKINLSRGGSLSGTVAHAEDGTPVDGATVTAAAVGGNPFTGSRSATTGPDGAFTIEALSSGRYTVRAEAAGLTSAEASNIIVDPGSPAQAIDLQMEGGVTLTGTITGVKESQLPDFTVRVLNGAFGKSAPVDSSGRFQVKGLAPGPMNLLASSGIFGGRSMTKTVEIPKGVSEFDTTIEFPKGNTVRGMVTRGGEPIAGATVIFRSEATRDSSTGSSDAAGQYSVEDLEPGDYDVDVLSFGSGASHSVKCKVDSDEDFDIDLPVRRITGRVIVAGSNKPIDGASISIEKSGESSPAAGSGPRIFFGQGSRTDATGTFRIEGIEDGSYTLTARRDGYALEKKSLDLVDGAEPGPVVIEMSPSEGFSFRATDTQSGIPMKSISVLAVRSGGAADPLATGAVSPQADFRGSLSADAGGTFHVDTLPPGTYDIVLGGQGIASENLRGVKVPSAATSVSMVDGGSVEIRLSAASGGTPGGAAARGVLLEETSRLVVRTNTFFTNPVFEVRPGETFTLRSVKPGRYIVRLVMPDGSTVERSAAVAAGATGTISLP